MWVTRGSGERRKLTDLREAREDLNRTLELTWGALVAELGKDAADGFFPAADAGDDEKDEGEGTPPGLKRQKGPQVGPWRG